MDPVPARALAVSLACVMLGGLLGCSGAPSRRPDQGRPSTEQTPSAPASGPAAVADLTLRLEEVAVGFERPLLVTNAGDGSERLFVVEQRGLVRVVRDGNIADKSFLDVTREVSEGGERGLLGLAFAPDFEQSGTFYVNYTDRRGDTVVARYVADDPSSDAPRLSEPKVLLKVDQPYANHNGGCTVFGPDGRLYVGMGDGGSGGDPQGRAQNDSTLLGKLLALDVGSAGRPAPAIVAKGLRNPWRFSFDRDTGDLWIGDVGQNAWEEIDFVPAGELGRRPNFGWNKWEGNHPYPEGSNPPRAGFDFPVIEHPRDQAQSITGGYVYRGKAEPAMAGAYIYGDFSAGWIAAARKRGNSIDYRIVIPDSGIAPSSFGEDEAGELYVCDYRGGLYRIRTSE